jgi:hypothetical protein
MKKVVGVRFFVIHEHSMQSAKTGEVRCGSWRGQPFEQPGACPSLPGLPPMALDPPLCCPTPVPSDQGDFAGIAA